MSAPLCDGDAIRTGRNARAALWIAPENIVRLDQQTTVGLTVTDELTQVEFFTGSQVSSDPECGAAYFISRFPRRFRVKTPYVNASIEGTEFLVLHRCSISSVAVYEGVVRAELADGSVSEVLRPGEQASAGHGIRGLLRTRIERPDQIQWAVYYPRVESGRDTALEEACPHDDQSLECSRRSIEALLAAGRVEDAGKRIADLAAIDGGMSDHYSYRALLAVSGTAPDRVEGQDSGDAMALARLAVDADHRNPRAHLVLSYAWQATGSIDAALSAAAAAQELDPASGLYGARVAELTLIRGDVIGALRHAKNVVEKAPHEARAHQILGFILLSAHRSLDAEQSFQRAVELDPEDPYSRLGLGLAQFRRGATEDGRTQLEIAAALDPRHSLVRSYLAKAYFEQRDPRRLNLALDQLDLAMELDRKDPTPWLYRGLIQRTRNAAVEAIADVRESVRLNGNRTVYRSRLLLDEDAATRSADLAGMYQELGFDRLALIEAARSVQIDPTNASGHRFLANAFARSERRDAARVSALLQSQLFQSNDFVPATAYAPFLDLGILAAPVPLRPSLYEQTALLDVNRTMLELRGAAGNLGTLSDEVLFHRKGESASFSVGQFFYQTDGFRPNNDRTHRIRNLFGQVALAPGVYLQAEHRNRLTGYGDIALNGRVEDYSPWRRQSIRSESTRVALRVAMDARTDVVFAAATQRNSGEGFEFLDFVPMSWLTRSSEAGENLEAQGIRRFDAGNVIVGVGSYSTRVGINSLSDPGGVFQFDGTTLRNNAYLLGTVSMFERRLNLTAGAYYQRFEDGGLRRDGVFPRVGILFEPWPWLILRAAVFKSMRPSFIAEQTIEPAQLVGFGYYYDDVIGTLSRTYSAAIDWLPGKLTHIGIEAQKRRLEDPSYPSGDLYLSRPVEERQLVSIRHVFEGGVAVGGDYVRERISRPYEDAQMFFAHQSLSNEFIPVHLRYAFVDGPTAGLTVTRVKQRVMSDFLYPNQTGRSEFTLVDAGLWYRLPRRSGTVSLEIRNLFDRSFEYQDLNFLTAVALNPRFLPTRTGMVRVSLNF